MQQQFLRTNYWGWGAAIVGALCLHGALAVTALWQPPVTAVPVPATSNNNLAVAFVSTQAAIPPKTQPKMADKQPQKLPERADGILQTLEKKAESPIDEQANDEKMDEDQVVEEVVEEVAEAADGQDSPEISEEFTESFVSAPAAMTGANNPQGISAELQWQHNIQAYLDRRKRYPKQALIRKQQGAPWVRFTMNREGRVLSAELAKSSGYLTLDNEVLSLVKRAAPLPKPPANVRGDIIALAVPIDFSIR